MNLYTKRQLAARIHDVIKRNNHVDLVVSAQKANILKLKDLFSEIIGDEEYLRFDSILSQYDLYWSYDIDKQKLFFRNNNSRGKQSGDKMGVSLSFIYNELEPEVKKQLINLVSGE